MAYNPLALGLMLVGIGAFMFALFLWNSTQKKSGKKTATADSTNKSFGTIFITLGSVAAIFAFILYTLQPIPDHYIEVYGVGYFTFTAVMILAGVALLKNWDFKPISYFAALGGVTLLSSAYTVYTFSMSKSPLGTTTIFTVSGLAAISSIFYTHVEGESTRNRIAAGAIILLVIVGLLTLYSGVHAQIGHVASMLTT